MSYRKEDGETTSQRRGFSAEGTRYGIVVSRFNSHVTEGVLQKCLEVMRSHSVCESDVTVVYVPGSLEIPVALQALAEKSSYDALIAIGCIMRGDTYHFDVVANESARGIMDVSLSYGVPIANGVMTVETQDQANERVQSGADMAYVAMDMALLFRDMSK